MKRLLAVLALGVAAVLGLAAPAAAHPLGNFTTNQYAGLRVGTSGVTIDYVIDLAELPAFQARRDEIGDALPAWAQHTCTAVAADTALTVDGQAARVAVRAARAESRPGSGGLETIRVECALRAEATIHEGTTVDYRGTAFENRIGWREVTAVGDRATLTGSSVPAATISGRLSAYPAGTGPLDIRAAHLLVRPGGPAAPAVAGFTDPAPGPGVTAWFDDLIGRPELTLGVGLLALLTAMVLGAAHAVAPGHGKTVMAAYLVAQRGRRKQALQLAGTVAAIHTLGVLVLAVALAASLEIAPAAMYGVLKLASGVLVAGLGVVLLRRAWVGRPLAAVGHRGHDGGHGHGHDHDGGHGHGHDGGHGHGHDHDGGHGHGHDGGRGHGHDDGHGHGHDDGHGHDHGHGHGGGHGHDHGQNRHERVSSRTAVAMGFIGGLSPSPSAVVVLLGAAALDRAWFGVLLVVAYGIGMAAALTGIGIALARWGLRLQGRLDARRAAWLTRRLPALAAGAILIAGLAVTTIAIVDLGHLPA